MTYVLRQGTTPEQRIAYRVIDAYIDLVHAALMQEGTDEHCHHLVNMLLLAYELKHRIRCGKFNLIPELKKGVHK